MIVVATIGVLALLTLVIGLLLAFTPYLMPRTECFAVTVPVAAQRDPRLVALKRHYTVAMLVLTAVATAVSLAAGALMVAGQEVIGTVLMSVALLVPMVVSRALMLRNRHRVIALKCSEGWGTRRHQAVASVAEEDLPGAIPLAWDLIYVPVILVTACLGLALYPSMPDLLPMHADFLGNINRYVPKTLGSALGFPLAFEAFMGACFVFAHWAILHSKCPSDPDVPATSALAYGRFARAQSVFLLVMGGAHERGLRPSVPALVGGTHRAWPGGAGLHGPLHPHRRGQRGALGRLRPGGLARVQEDAGRRRAPGRR